KKLAILQCFLLKNGYGSSLVRQHPILWDKRIQREGDEEAVQMGLGWKGVIQKYGFGWLPTNVFNLEANTFAPGIADQFPFPIRQLEKRYQKRKREWKMMNNILQETDQIIGRIKILRDNK